MRNKVGSRKEKRGLKVNFKTMIIAMIVALLAFLRLGNFELGDGNNQNASNDVYNESSSESEQSQDEMTSDGESVEYSYRIYVKGEEIFVTTEEAGELVNVSLSFIEEEIMMLDSQTRILLYDDGAVNKTYNDVKELVEKSKLRFDEFITNN